MAKTIEETFAALITRGRAKQAELDAAIRGLPDEGDIPAPNERARVWQRRQVLVNHRGNLGMAVYRASEHAPKLAELRPVEAKLSECFEALSKALDAHRELPKPGGYDSMRHEQREQALVESLHLLEHGPQSSPEVTRSVLVEQFAAVGLSPEPGQHGYFAGRGGLRTLRARIELLERAEAAGVQELRDVLTSIDAKELVA